MKCRFGPPALVGHAAAVVSGRIISPDDAVKRGYSKIL